MLVKDIMTPNTIFVSRGTSLDDAARIMRQERVGFLPVRDGGQLVGVLTDRDLALGPHEHALPYDALTVDDVMSPHAHAVRAHAPIVGAAAAMKEKRCRRLLVLDENSLLVGVLSLGDLASRMTRGALAADVLRTLAAGAQAPHQPQPAHA